MCADYRDPFAGNQQKYLAMVPVAAPQRLLDLGTVSQGLTLGSAVATGTSIGTVFFDLPRFQMPYTSLLIRLRGTLSTTSGSAGTALSAFNQYDFLRNVELTMNGGDKFISLGGGSLWAWNLFTGQYRNSEVVGEDVLGVAPSSGANNKAFDLTYLLQFHDPTIFPRLFSMLNAYEGHGVTSMQLRLDIADAGQFVSGDANLKVNLTDVQLMAQVLDYSLLPGYGEQYVRETSFCRLEIRQLGPIALANASNQRTKLDRGLYYRGVLVIDLNTSTPNQPAANNITAVTFQRDSNDIFINAVKIPHLQRIIADRYGFNTYAQGENFIYFFDFAPQREASQFYNTYNFTDWDMLVNSGAAGNMRILEIMYNIPPVPEKNPKKVMNTFRKF